MSLNIARQARSKLAESQIGFSFSFEVSPNPAHIRMARLRRSLSGEQVAKRAGMIRQTLVQVEKGHPSVTLGSYLNVLHVLGLHGDLSFLAKDDELGRRLQDAALEVKARAPKRKKKKK